MELIGSQGETKLYKIVGSKKRLGAALQSIDPELEKELIQRHKNNN